MSRIILIEYLRKVSLFRSIFIVGLFILFYVACSDRAVAQKDIKSDIDISENAPDAERACFNGAYYRKIVSSMDDWVGISGKVRLPEIHFDSTRLNLNKPGQFLDNPTIYMGGSSDGQETDIGLTWEVIKEKDGSISKERKAYRPFLRRNAYGKTKQQFIWISGTPDEKFYWYPNDVVNMSVKKVDEGVLELVIEGEGKRFEMRIDCDAYVSGMDREFKRVNAIDQVGNEGKYVQPTNTRVINATWFDTYLHKVVNGKQIKVPMKERRFTDMRCPDPKFVEIMHNGLQKALGAESISLFGKSYP